MSRIVFISPYRDLALDAKSVAEELGITIEIYEVWWDQAVPIIENLKGPPIDIIMTRGGTAEYLAQKIPHIPVVPVNTGPFDIIECVQEAKKYSDDIVLTAYSKPIIGMQVLGKVMGVSITELLFFSLKDLNRKIAAIAKSGKQCCIVGGGPSVAYAAQHGLPNVFLRTNRNTLHTAFLQADQLVKLKKEEDRKTHRLKAILDAAYEGIIAIDQAGTVEIFNAAAERKLKIAAHEVIGQNIVGAVPNTRLEKILITGQPEINEFQDVGEARIVTNRIPIKDGSKIMGAVATFQEVASVVQTEQKLRKEITTKSQFKAKNSFSDIISVSAVMEQKKKLAKGFARSDLSVFIYGPSGTGKELFAQSMHNASARGTQPFVAVNCGALPSSLLESELFGYEEGAFTGAKRKGKYGLFELAHGGTIFLDEIDALPLDMQGRLLRVLQEREVLRIGGESIVPINVRVIAATNKNPSELLRNHKIRDDLFYRLNVLYLELPALAARPEDIGYLCEDFLPPEDKQRLMPLVRRLLPYFEKYAWPGNVRELRNVIQRLAVFAELADPGGDIKCFLEMVAPDVLNNGAGCGSDACNLREHVRGVEDELIIRAVREQGTLDKAADYLGIGRSTLTRKLKKARESQLIHEEKAHI